jgi:hypothetical protein
MSDFDDKVVLLIRDAVIAFPGSQKLDFIDVIRNIYNSGFSQDSIRKALQHPNAAIRKQSEKFLRDVEELRQKPVPD